MEKQQVLDKLAAHKDRLDEFAVKALYLFGSVARDEATPDSDVDFLVEFDHLCSLAVIGEAVASAINELEEADSATLWHQIRGMRDLSPMSIFGWMGRRYGRRLS